MRISRHEQAIRDDLAAAKLEIDGLTDEITRMENKLDDADRRRLLLQKLLDTPAGKADSEDGGEET